MHDSVQGVPLHAKKILGGISDYFYCVFTIMMKLYSLITLLTCTSLFYSIRRNLQHLQCVH